MEATVAKLRCPLCHNDESVEPRWSVDKRRGAFAKCSTCGMAFATPESHLTAEAEKARYDTHNNDQHDEGYRNFLNRTGKPLTWLIARSILGGNLEADFPDGVLQIPESETADADVAAAKQALLEASTSGLVRPWEGLDYGCGPGPTLNLLLEATGVVSIPVSLYDLYFHDDPSALYVDCDRNVPRQYDFITSTEVVEHIAQCGEALDQMWSMVRPGGLLAIMTQRTTTLEHFESWWYKKDPTHICFFHESSFRFLSHKWGTARTWFVGKDVVIFLKRAHAAT